MADDDQNYAVFNSRMLVDTVGDITDEALKAGRIKDIIGVLAGRMFNWGQRKSLFPLHLGIKCCALEMVPRRGLEPIRRREIRRILPLQSQTVRRPLGQWAN